MKKSQIAAQLYSFRDQIKTEDDFIKTLATIRKIGYEAVQLSSSIPAMTAKRLAEILVNEGLKAPTSHDQAAKIIAEPEAVAERLASLKCFHTAYPYPHSMPENEESCIKLALEINTAALKMKKYGVKLAYHNHAIELRHFNGKTMLDIIYDNAPDIEAEIDTFWIQNGGANPLSWIRKSEKRMEVIHLKDAGILDGGSAMMPLGEGNLEWAQLIPAAEKAGVKVFVVEHDGNCKDPFESFKTSFEYLSKHFAK